MPFLVGGVGGICPVVLCVGHVTRWGLQYLNIKYRRAPICYEAQSRGTCTDAASPQRDRNALSCGRHASSTPNGDSFEVGVGGKCCATSSPRCVPFAPAEHQLPRPSTRRPDLALRHAYEALVQCSQPLQGHASCWREEWWTRFRLRRTTSCRWQHWARSSSVRPAQVSHMLLHVCACRRRAHVHVYMESSVVEWRIRSGSVFSSDCG